MYISFHKAKSQNFLYQNMFHFQVHILGLPPDDCEGVHLADSATLFLDDADSNLHQKKKLRH